VQWRPRCRADVAGDLRDPSQQQPGRAELGDRGELVDGGGEAQLELGERGGELEAAGGEAAQRGDGGRQAVAELLGVGCPGVVVAGRVDRGDAHGRVLGDQDASFLRQRAQIGIDVDGASIVEPLAERVGAEGAGCALDVIVGPDAGEGRGGLVPAKTGVEHDGRKIEQDPVERAPDELFVEIGLVAEP
jgi:hypothetical protein